MVAPTKFIGSSCHVVGAAISRPESYIVYKKITTQMGGDFWVDDNMERCFASVWTRFSAEKPRRLRHATGMSPRAAFRVLYLEYHTR